MSRGTRRGTPARVAADRHTWVDLGLLAVLLVVTLLGLAPTFQGWDFLLVGVVGAVVGIGAGLLARTLAWPSVAAVLVAVAGFYLLGGVLCLRGDGGQSMVPGASAGALTHEALFGWKDLLTTLPPLDAAGPLLVLPFLLGVVGGVTGALLALVPKGPAWLVAPLPVLAPLVLLAVVILVGLHRPQSLWLQGVGFAAVSLVWIALRHQRMAGTVRGSSSRVGRSLTAGALLAGAALLALPVGSWAAGSDAHRTILRSYVAPPFDIGQYPSPLASFRRYVDEKKHPAPENLYHQRLFTVTGIPAGTRVRIATLDTYDGVIYGASNGSEPGPVDDTFQRVSSRIDNPTPGTPVSGTVTVDRGYGGVWLPSVGAMQELQFRSGDSDQLADTFRYNLATSTGVVPSGLGPGDSYSFQAVLPAEKVTPRDVPGPPLVATAVDAGFLDTLASKWAQGSSNPMKQVFAIAGHLKHDGRYSDGVTRAQEIYHAGHNEHRLLDDQGGVNSPTIVGNDEQYAAWMALMANQVGVPARVVFGAVVPRGGVVRGKDVAAWVELRVGDGSWRTLPTSAFMSHRKPADQPPQSQQQMTGTDIPPPQPIQPPSTVGDQANSNLRAQKSEHHKRTVVPKRTPVEAAVAWIGKAITYVGVPVLLIAALLGAIVGAKLLRRRRRRSATRVSARFVGGWRELVDHARDLGQPIPVGPVTRRQQAVAFADGGAPPLARTADRFVFGPDVPAAEAAAAYWRDIDAERHAMSQAAGRRRRVRAALSLTTFRRA